MSIYAFNSANKDNLDAKIGVYGRGVAPSAFEQIGEDEQQVRIQRVKNLTDLLAASTERPDDLFSKPYSAEARYQIADALSAEYALAGDPESAALIAEQRDALLSQFGRAAHASWEGLSRSQKKKYYAGADAKDKYLTYMSNCEHLRGIRAVAHAVLAYPYPSARQNALVVKVDFDYASAQFSAVNTTWDFTSAPSADTDALRATATSTRREWRVINFDGNVRSYTSHDFDDVLDYTFNGGWDWAVVRDIYTWQDGTILSGPWYIW